MAFKGRGVLHANLLHHAAPARWLPGAAFAKKWSETDRRWHYLSTYRALQGRALLAHLSPLLHHRSPLLHAHIACALLNKQQLTCTNGGFASSTAGGAGGCDRFTAFRHSIDAAVKARQRRGGCNRLDLSPTRRSPLACPKFKLSRPTVSQRSPPVSARQHLALPASPAAAAAAASSHGNGRAWPDPPSLEAEQGGLASDSRGEGLVAGGRWAWLQPGMHACSTSPLCRRARRRCEHAPVAPVLQSNPTLSIPPMWHTPMLHCCRMATMPGTNNAGPATQPGGWGGHARGASNARQRMRAGRACA